jgi:hypothetical protein
VPSARPPSSMPLPPVASSSRGGARWRAQPRPARLQQRSQRGVTMMADSIAPLRLLSPTPTVDGDDAPGASVAVVDVEAVAPRLPSPTAATPPTSPRTRARHRHTALGYTLSPPSGGHQEPGHAWVREWRRPGTQLPGGSSDEDERGWSTNRRR